MRALLGLVFALALVPHATHADTPAGAPKSTAPAVTAKPAPPEKPVAKMSRAELEAEVTALRAENKKVKLEFEAALAKERDRAKRLEKQIGQPAAELK
jgi:hypothetical protein